MKIKNFIADIWQLPQNILGFIIKKICHATLYIVYEGVNVYSWDLKGEMSLGKYIFVPFVDEDLNEYRIKYVKHEYGHTIQSKYLGWFYLLVIGLPSIVWAGCFRWYRKKTGVSYYSFYTEKSADKIGKVNREGLNNE